MLSAMSKEIFLRMDHAHGEMINTIYFGGGTPSMLTGDELKVLQENIFRSHEVSRDAEITLEANPDDLDRQKIKSLKEAGVNRLSIGIQSFRDVDLKLMNRAHLSTQADYAVKSAQDAGFENITIDLIYSIPGLSLSDWKKNVEIAIDLNVQHISAYSLTIEPKTVFGHKFAKGQLHQVDDKLSQDQFLYMVETLGSRGFQQYEVSNFAKKGFESRHNSSYWSGEKYIGIGPSAHGYDGTNRYWNVSNNPKYIRAVESGDTFSEMEILTSAMRFNEYIMTGLRTIKGINTQLIREKFDVELKEQYPTEIEQWLNKGWMQVDGNTLFLTSKGLLFADKIASDLFIIT